MMFSPQLSFSLAKYVIRNRLRGRQRFPLALMLEPSFRCNLACAGCGRIREFADSMDQMLTVEQCLAAVDEAGTPVVCLTGGEPLLHPDIEAIVDGIIARRRLVYLSTNGFLLHDAVSRFKPSPHFSFAVHLDGLAERHDRMAGRSGVFEAAVAGIRAARGAGFQVRTNTTVYKGANLQEIKGLFVLLSQLGVKGIMVAPAFGYEGVGGDVFLSRNEIAELFRPMYAMRTQFRFYNTPAYLEFLAGKRDLACTPWSNPTRNPKGWKRPCYLITDGHCQSFRELMDETPWGQYGVGKDPRCANCMMHCGFEASALNAAGKSLPALWRMGKWNLFGS